MNANFENYKEKNETETNFDSKQEKRKFNIVNSLMGFMPKWLLLVILLIPVATILYNPTTVIGFTLIPALILPFLPAKKDLKGFKKLMSVGKLAFIYFCSLVIYFDIIGIVILAVGLVVLEVKRFAPLKKYFNFKIFMFGFSIVALAYAFDIAPLFRTVKRRTFGETVLYYNWKAADNHYWAILIQSILLYFVLFAIAYTFKRMFGSSKSEEKTFEAENSNTDSVSSTNQNEFNEANSQVVDDEEFTIIEKASNNTSERIDPSEASYDSGDYVYVNKSDYDGIFTPIKKWARKD